MRGLYGTPQLEAPVGEVRVSIVSSNPWKDMFLGAAVGFAFTKVVEHLLEMRSPRKKVR